MKQFDNGPSDIWAARGSYRFSVLGGLDLYELSREFFCAVCIGLFLYIVRKSTVCIM